MQTGSDVKLVSTADRAASVSTYVDLISALQTLEQAHGKSKLVSMCLRATCEGFDVITRKPY